MPACRWPRASTAKFSGEQWSELQDPSPHRFVGDIQAALCATSRICSVDLRSIRPIALAKLRSAPPDYAVELFLAAARNGIVAMGWDLLCPRCRGAKSRVSRLRELPKGAHCSSCNVDYERNFSRNVELTFHPEPWIRPLPDGEMCVLGQGAARHIKFQGEVAAHTLAVSILAITTAERRYDEEALAVCRFVAWLDWTGA
jgi:Family of unknown function (DUF5939)